MYAVKTQKTHVKNAQKCKQVLKIKQINTFIDLKSPKKIGGAFGAAKKKKILLTVVQYLGTDLVERPIRGRDPCPASQKLN